MSKKGCSTDWRRGPAIYNKLQQCLEAKTQPGLPRSPDLPEDDIYLPRTFFTTFARPQSSIGNHISRLCQATDLVAAQEVGDPRMM